MTEKQYQDMDARCQERMERLSKAIAEDIRDIKVSLFGNGGVGIKTRVTIMENEIKHITDTKQLFMGGLVAILVATFMAASAAIYGAVQSASANATTIEENRQVIREIKSYIQEHVTADPVD